MKGAVIGLGGPTSIGIARAMENYFDKVDFLQLRDHYVEISREGIQMLTRKGELEDYDCLYPRGSYRYAPVLITIASSLSGHTYIPLRADSFIVGHDKFLTHLALMKQKIKMPNTFIIPTVKTAKLLLKEINYPIVMKFPHGTQGRGVVFAESYAAAVSVLDVLEFFKNPFLIQEYVETESTDIRALVVGDKVVAGMRRVAQKGEKRANIHMGGTGEAIKLNAKTSKIALASAEAVGADICAVDMLETPIGPLVIEVNLSPGVQGLKEATDRDIEDDIAKFLYEQTKANRRVKNGQEMASLIDTNSADKHSSGEIIINADLRGGKLVLPEVISSLANLSESQEMIVEVLDGEIILRPIKKVHQKL